MRERRVVPNWSYQGEYYTICWNGTDRTFSIRSGQSIEIRSFKPLALARDAKQAQEAVSSGKSDFPGFGTASFPRQAHARQLSVHEDCSVHCTADSIELRAPAIPEEPRLSYRVVCSPHAATLEATFSSGRYPVALDSVIPISGECILEGHPSTWTFFKMSSNTTTPSGSLRLTDSERTFGFGYIPYVFLPRVLKRMLYLHGESVSWRRGILSSQWFTSLTRSNDGRSLILGFLGSRAHFSTIYLDQRKRLIEAVAHADGIQVPSGKSFSPHPCVLIFGNQPHTCIERYVASFASRTSPRKRRISLWGSWYAGFYDRITAGDLEENLARCAVKKQYVQYFQIDDGYQKALGDWLETNSRLPQGLCSFAGEVIRRGLTPGIWLAPFVAGRDSFVYRHHPDWLVKGAAGRPLVAGLMPGRVGLRPYYALDTTLPEVQQWLRTIFQTLVDWGFGLFKLDYLAAGALHGRRADPKATAAQAYSLGLSVIRETVGDLPIMGALAPLLAGVGWFDMQRVSPDTSFGGNRWARPVQRILRDPITPCIRNNIRNNFVRAFFHDWFWTNDCDALVRDGLSEEEARTHFSANLLLGGVCQIGHDMRKGGFPWEHITRILAIHPVQCRVPDLFEKHVPEEAMIVATRVGVPGRFLYYLFVNSTDNVSRTRVRNPGDYFSGIDVQWTAVRDFWQGAAADIRDGDLITLPPHGCRVFEFTLA